MKRQMILLFASLFMLYPAFGQGASIDVHRVETPYIYGRQEIRVLLPENYDRNKNYRVLYVLPAERSFDRSSGNGLVELQEMNAHNLYDLILVQMGFGKEPWFGDHISDPRTRQASYIKEFIVPFIESKYSTLEAREGRLLFGFSKGGWGAFSLIMRYPEYFGYAAAWDAPLLLSELHFGMRDVYGDAKQLNLYRPDLLISKQNVQFQNKTRLVLTGEQAWGSTIPAPGGGSHTREAHGVLEKNSAKHVFDAGVWAPHRWHKAWMYPTLSALMSLTMQDEISLNQKNQATFAAAGSGMIREPKRDCPLPKLCPVLARNVRHAQRDAGVAMGCC